MQKFGYQRIFIPARRSRKQSGNTMNLKNVMKNCLISFKCLFEKFLHGHGKNASLIVPQNDEVKEI
ncbi:hypothetical protein T08_15249 [Trichinella sp. T8]|nr:hypothetical protein T08_15249 [Trichinella sp. T8]